MRTLTLALALCLLGACAKNRGGAEPAPTAALQPAPAPAQRDRPSPPPIIETPDAERAGPATTPMNETPQQAPAPTASSPARALPGPERRGDDGRPEWFLREPRWSDARLTICAEALGATVLDARRAAVEAGLARIDSLLDRAAPNAEVVVATVRPLPVPAEAPGGMRFVGYVMVTARTDDASGR